jgi:hypothetical protein
MNLITTPQNEDSKAALYQNLQATVDNLKNKDINIFMGEFQYKCGIRQPRIQRSGGQT